MKLLIAAIVFSTFALTGTAALAIDMQRQGAAATDHVIQGLGLLLDTPRTPVGEIYSPSTELA